MLQRKYTKLNTQDTKQFRISVNNVKYYLPVFIVMSFAKDSFRRIIIRNIYHHDHYIKCITAVNLENETKLRKLKAQKCVHFSPAMNDDPSAPRRNF